MIKYITTLTGILFLVTMPVMAQENEVNSKKDRFFSIGFNYGFNYTRIGGDISRGSGGMGSSGGIQINARVIALFKGDLSTSFGVTAFEGPNLYFFDDRLNDELTEYEVSYVTRVMSLNLRWSPKGELVPYIDLGLYYYGMASENSGGIVETSTDELIKMSNIDGYGNILGTGFKYHKKGSRIQTTLGFERYSDFYFSRNNNMFNMTFNTINFRFTASYLLF